MSSSDLGSGKNEDLELRHLFKIGISLFDEGDLHTAMQFFQAYLSRGSEHRDVVLGFIARIGKTSMQAAALHQKRNLSTQAMRSYELAVKAGEPRDGSLEIMAKAYPIAPSLPQFRAPAPLGSAVSVLRYPHMNITGGVPVKADQRFEAIVFADDVPPRDGEQSQALELPADGQQAYLLDVCLLTSAHFDMDGPQTQRITLRRSERATDAARFRIRVRPLQRMTDLMTRPASLCALFRYGGRTIGKVLQSVAIDGMEPLAVPSDPPYLPKMGEAIVLEPGTKQADLVVTVASQGDNDQRHFWCTVQTPHLKEYVEGITTEWNLPDVTSAIVSGYMQAFTAPGLSKIERLASLRGAGKNLFKLSPEVFQNAFWKLLDQRKPLNSISVISSEPYVAWELMLPHRDLGVDVPPEIRQPLGVEFSVGRMARRSLIPGSQQVPLKDSYVIAPIFDGPLALPHAQDEADCVTHAVPGKRISADMDSLDTNFANCASVVHFACHGEVQKNGQQVLFLEGGKQFTALQLSGLPGPERGIPVKRPLVFLNACQAGQPVPGLVGPGGFAAVFAELGARAVIAPLWSVKDTLAHQVAVDLYAEVLKKPPLPFAEILRRNRAKAYDPLIAEDTFAAYCFFGDPLAIAS